MGSLLSTFIFGLKKLRHQEFKQCAQDLTAEWEEQHLKPGNFGPLTAL